MHRTSDRISVVIPTYNDGHLLGPCIASIADQSVPISEVILVDDGSSDPTSVLALDQLVGAYPKVRLIRKENGGPASARNVGLSQSAGRYIVFVDADDRLRPNCIESRLNLLKEGRVAAAFSGYEAVYESGLKKFSNFTSMDAQIPSADLIGKPGGFPGGLPMYIFSREALQTVGELDEELLVMEDFDLILRLVQHGFTISGTNCPSYIRYVRSDSLTRSAPVTKLLASLRFLAKARRSSYFSSQELILRTSFVCASFGKEFLASAILRNPRSQ